MQVIAPVTVARAAAWGLLFGGWLTVGALAQWQAAPGWASALPHAVWLLALATLPGLAARAPLSDGVLGALLLTLAMVAAAGLLLQVPAALLALPWAALVVAASRVVRRLRPPQPLPAGAVLAAAAGGVTPAWLLAGDASRLAAAPAPLALAVLAAAAVATWALRTAPPPTRGSARPGCQRSLMDCALTWPDWPSWRQPAQWPRPAAALVMLPAMAALPTLSAQCAAFGVPTWAVSAAHAAAMLVPAALWLRLARVGTADDRPGHPPVTLAMAWLLAAGGAAPWIWPGARGLMLGMLLQTAAWSLAWCTDHLAPRTTAAPPPHTARPRPSGRRVAAVFGALLVLAATSGAEAWLWVQSLLGLLGVIGLAGWVGLAQPGRAGRAPRQALRRPRPSAR